jgi:putative Holliday junction resolvase
VLEFVEQLRGRVTIPIATWDERLTTAEAEKMLIERDTRRKKRRQVIDQIAAALILEGYLRHQVEGQGSRLLSPYPEDE